MKLKTSNSEVRLSLNKITKKLINNQNDRYFGTKDKQQIDKKIINLLSEKQKISSYAIGLGLRFLYNFSAGLTKNLDSIKFKIKKNKLTCKIKAEAKALMDKENERRLKNFANACNLNCDII